MRIEPHAWLLTVPVTIGLIQLYFQPADSVIKRWWKKLIDIETQTWERLMQRDWRRGPGRMHQMRRLLFGLMVLAFAITSVMSFGAFMGVIPGN